VCAARACAADWLLWRGAHFSRQTEFIQMLNLIDTAQQASAAYMVLPVAMMCNISASDAPTVANAVQNDSSFNMWCLI
jgi:hypothetical protein